MIKEYNSSKLTSITVLKDLTENFTKPVLFVGSEFKSHSLKNDLQSIDKKIEGKLHSSSYWNFDPLGKIVQKQSSDFSLDELLTAGNYYLSKFSSDNGASGKLYGQFQNIIDKLLTSHYPIEQQLLNDSYFCSYWLSNGSTVSSMHADPLHALFCQMEGQKEIILIKNNMKTLSYKDALTPHVMKFESGISFSDDQTLQSLGLQYEKVVIKPGDMLFVPVWYFHHVTTPSNELNLSLMYYIKPSLKRVFSFNHWHNLIVRQVYPKAVKKKRIKYQLDNLSAECIPLYSANWQLLKRVELNYPENSMNTHCLISSGDSKNILLHDEDEIKILSLINSRNTIGHILEESNLSEDFVYGVIIWLISNSIIHIWWEHEADEEKFNYFHFPIEVRTY